MKRTEFKEGIQATKERVDDTLNTLSDKLDPSKSIDRLTQWVETTSVDDAVIAVKNSSRKAVDHIGRHPMPYALAGAGMAWLAVEVIRSHNKSTVRQQVAEGCDRATEKGSAIAAEAKERASETVKDVADKAAEVKQSIKSHSEEIISKGREKINGSADSITEVAKENPIAVGGGLLAIGVLAGLLIPRTRVEDGLLGTMSDDLANDVRGAGKNVLSRGRDAVKEAVSSTKNAVEKQARDLSEAVRS